MAEQVESREKAVPKYFIETPKKPEAPDTSGYETMSVIGGTLALAGLVLLFTGSTGGVCSGLIGLPLGGILLFIGLTSPSTEKHEYAEKLKEYEKEYERAEPKPSDAQMDEWLQNDRERIRAEALEKLDLDPSQVVHDPIEIIGPTTNADLAVGEDGIIRFSKYDIVTVFLTDYHLAAYQCTLDMVHGTQTSESTQEYHYQDVVSVATQTEGSNLFAVMVNGKEKSIHRYQKFSLAVSSGDHIEVVISFPQVEDIIKDGRLAPTGADEAIRVIRARLREMKGGIQE